MCSISNPGSGGPTGGDHRFILHIADSRSWRAQRGEPGGYRDPSLDDEGFIHCSTVDQFLVPANERFAGRDGLVLLVIDTELLDVRLVYEDCYDTGSRFPHVYGPIPGAAVVEVVDFPASADGGFEEPAALRPLLAGLG